MTDGALVDARGRPRIVVTGMGVKTPAGNDVASFWSRILEARPAAAPIARFDASALPVRFACEVTDFDPEPYIGAKEVRRFDRVTHLGFAAAADALADAGELHLDPGRCAVVASSGIGGLGTLEDQAKNFFDRGPSRVSPFFVTSMMPNATAGLIAIRFGWTGPNLCLSTACAAGAHAIGEGVRLIRDGTSDAVMAGGAEAVLTPLCVSAFAKMGALSSRNDDPEHASRPFDRDRDGFVMGEGAGFVMLERIDHALARGARIYGEVVGYGRNADAFHITAPSPGGAGAAACMQLALDDAGLTTDDIGHINAHGTSTPLNDAAEAAAILKVFGDQGPPVTSAKGVTGHLVGAAGAVEAVATLLSIREGVIPPTANHEHPDDDMSIDVVVREPRSLAPAPAMSNSFGFGGHNVSLVFRPAS